MSEATPTPAPAPKKQRSAPKTRPQCNIRGCLKEGTKRLHDQENGGAVAYICDEHYTTKCMGYTGYTCKRNPAYMFRNTALCAQCTLTYLAARDKMFEHEIQEGKQIVTLKAVPAAPVGQSRGSTARVSIKKSPTPEETPAPFVEKQKSPPPKSPDPPKEEDDYEEPHPPTPQPPPKDDQVKKSQPKSGRKVDAAKSLLSRTAMNSKP